MKKRTQRGIGRKGRGTQSSILEQCIMAFGDERSQWGSNGGLKESIKGRGRKFQDGKEERPLKRRISRSPATAKQKKK